MTEEESEKLVELNAQISELENRHKRAKTQTLHWESILSRIKSANAAKYLESSQVRTSVWNLYRQLCNRKNIRAEARKEDLEQHLLHIKGSIIGLQKIVKSALAKQQNYLEENKESMETQTRKTTKVQWKNKVQ